MIFYDSCLENLCFVFLYTGGKRDPDLELKLNQLTPKYPASLALSVLSAYNWDLDKATSTLYERLGAAKASSENPPASGTNS